MIKATLLTTVFPKLSETFILEAVIYLLENEIDFSVFPFKIESEEDSCSAYHENKLQLRTFRMQHEKRRFSRKFSVLKKRESGSELELADHGLISLAAGRNIKLNNNEQKVIRGLIRSRHRKRFIEWCSTLRDQLIKDKPDLIHAHFLTPAGVAAWLLGQELQIPYMLQLYGIDVFKHGLSKPTEAKAILENADFVVANSEFMKSKLLSIAPNLSNIRAINHGIDLRKFEGLNSNRPDKFTIVTVSRLTEKKGIRYLIEACARIQNELPSFELVIVGEGKLRGKLERLTASLGIKNQCRFMGTQPNNRVLQIMSEASVFVLPCIEGKDGNMDSTPCTIQEARMLGLPCISTSISGIPELISDGGDGLLVPERNVERLVEAIIRLYRDKNLYSNLSQAGKMRVMNDFDMGQQIHKFIGLYNRILSS